MVQQDAKRRRSNSRRPVGEIEAEISDLATLSLSELRERWTKCFGGDALPIRSRDVLVRMLAWQLQADTFGGFDATTERQLREISINMERGGSITPKTRQTLSPGVMISREWRGVVHTVTRTKSGFQHLGKCYRSLSDVARVITGTRWSGPRFFGLEQKPAAAVERNEQ